MKRLSKASFRVFGRNSSFFIVFIDLIIQFFLIGKYLDNSVISPYAPTAIDASDYAARAETWQADGFNKAFSDAYRMPGYPFIIYLMRYILPSAPYLGVRLFQMLTVAISVGLIYVLLKKYVSIKIAILVSIFYGLLPVWHFVPVLLAESLTSVVVVGLLFLLASITTSGATTRRLFLLSLVIAIGTYLKPNNLSLIIPSIIYLALTLKKYILKNLLLVIISVFLMITPWIVFASSVQPGFLGLTTNSGANFYVGTGMVLSYDGSVLARSAIKWKVDPNNNPIDLLSVTPDQSLSDQNSQLLKKSLNIWGERPLREIGFGIDKVLIAFGFKANSKIDHLFGLFSLFSIIAAVYLTRIPRVRVWGLSTLTVATVLAIQASVFQADRRFVVPIFFPFSIICLGLAIGKLPLQKIRLVVLNRIS